MVSTRSHPTTFPPPSLSPSKPPRPATACPRNWTHTPTPLTLSWLLLSLPLVIWDTAYVLLRPLSMPGGSLHSPLWTPYKLYGEVDYTYGWPAWDARSGFTGAQAALNLVETGGYVGYLGVVLWFSVVGGGDGNGGGGWWRLRWGSVGGGWGGVACLCGFGLSVMTVSKTVLYWLNEYFSGYANIGHNDFSSLLFLWIIPNGAWLILPSYMAYVFAKDILHGLAIASGDVDSKPARAATPSKDE